MARRTFVLDECLSISHFAALLQACFNGFHFENLLKTQKQGALDQEWIPFMAKRNAVILTIDGSMLHDDVEAQAISEQGLLIVIFKDAGNMRAHEKVWRITKMMSEIVERIDACDPEPAVLRVFLRAGKIKNLKQRVV